MPRSATINCASAREPQTTEYSYGRSATKESLKWEESENATYPDFYYPVWFIISIFLFPHFLPGCEQRAMQPFFFFLVMRGMMKRPRGTSKLSSLTMRVQFSDVLSAIFSETNKNKRRKNWTKTISWHHYSKFPPFLPLCVFLSLARLEPLQNLGWKDHMISYQKATAFPVSILLTLWRHLLSKSKR